ncbi:helix-turn-helix domain-containing protein [Secundilactobacillus kimchicus]|uniref:helix-turn-helix domain-containing protein n=1 Tax=Secundilactobacillus kimchicus TaxID=528209 RepID=UPI0024A9B8A4|nr:hypothetical protein [Secundilactobacillus kimchicus]
MNFSKTFRKGARKKGIEQTWLATKIHVAKSTLNGYFNGENTPLDNAVKITKEFDDFETSMSFANQVLGLFKLFTGPRFKHDVLSIDAFTAKEDSEADEAYARDHIRWLLADEDLSHEKKKALENFGAEDLDNILMHLERLDKICERTGITPMAMFARRMPYYVKQGYMTVEDLTDNQRHNYCQTLRGSGSDGI